nr:MAG TPA: hypothetical protein [Bacteriophage sp.]
MFIFFIASSRGAVVKTPPRLPFYSPTSKAKKHLTRFH